MNDFLTVNCNEMGLCAVDQVVYSQRTERKFADGSAVLIGVSNFSLIN